MELRAAEVCPGRRLLLHDVVHEQNCDAVMELVQQDGRQNCVVVRYSDAGLCYGAVASPGDPNYDARVHRRGDRLPHCAEHHCDAKLPSARHHDDWNYDDPAVYAAVVGPDGARQQHQGDSLDAHYWDVVAVAARNCAVLLRGGEGIADVR